MKKIIWGIGGLLAATCAAAAPDDSGGLWISGGKSWAIGASSGHGWYGRVMASPTGKGGFVLSHSHLFFEDYSFAPNNDSASVKETNLELGMIPAAHGALFLGIGVSRVQFDGPFCPTNEMQVNCVGAGLAAEAVLALPWAVGLEVRAFGNKNAFNDFVGISAGVRFGGGGTASDSTPAPAPIEITPQRPLPAAGKTARLKPGAQARLRPQMGAEGSLPAGTPVLLKTAVTNNEGTWWYVEANGQSGWVRAEDLDVTP